MPQDVTDDYLVSIVSGNGIVPSDTKPLPEPMLSTFYDSVWRHWARMIKSMLQNITLEIGAYVSTAAMNAPPRAEYDGIDTIYWSTAVY